MQKESVRKVECEGYNYKDKTWKDMKEFEYW